MSNQNKISPPMPTVPKIKSNAFFCCSKRLNMILWLEVLKQFFLTFNVINLYISNPVYICLSYKVRYVSILLDNGGH